MATQLNIKDAETIRLARAAAAHRNVSVTRAIRDALERDARDREAEVQRRIAAIKAAVAEFQAVMPPEWRHTTSKELMDSIYDEDGLPE